MNAQMTRNGVAMESVTNVDFLMACCLWLRENAKTVRNAAAKRTTLNKNRPNETECRTS